MKRLLLKIINMDELKKIFKNIVFLINRPNNLWFKVYFYWIIFFVWWIQIIDSFLKEYFPNFPFKLIWDDITLNFFNFYITIFITLSISINNLFKNLSKNSDADYWQRIIISFLIVLIVINLIAIFVTWINIIFAIFCYIISLICWILSVSDDESFNENGRKVGDIKEALENLNKINNNKEEYPI